MFTGITGSNEDADYELILSSEVSDNKEGRMHMMSSRFLDDSKQGHVCLLVVVCSSADYLWKVRTKYSRNKKAEGDER